MANADVIENDQCKGCTAGSLKHLINEADGDIPCNRVWIGRRFQVLGTEVQDSQFRARAMLGTLCRVWLTQWRPRVWTGARARHVAWS